MCVRCPDALRADMQRVYGLDADDIGAGIRVMRAADLAASLPPDALVWHRLDPRAGWDERTALLASTRDACSWIAWAMSKHPKGEKWRDQWPRPGDGKRDGHGDPTVASGTTEQVLDMLSRPRGKTESKETC